jgi:hypothetical protein
MEKGSPLRGPFLHGSGLRDLRRRTRSVRRSPTAPACRAEDAKRPTVPTATVYSSVKHLTHTCSPIRDGVPRECEWGERHMFHMPIRWASRVSLGFLLDHPTIAIGVAEGEERLVVPSTRV